MPDLVIDDRANELMANVISTLANVSIDGDFVFSAVLSVNDVESFVRVADPIKDRKPVCGVVEGSIEEAAGSSDNEKVCRLPFDIIVRFFHRRGPGESEAVAMQKAKRYIEIVKAALMVDKGRGGKANLIRWGNGVINGTTVSGLARPLTRIPNEGFFSIVVSAAVVWSKS